MSTVSVTERISQSRKVLQTVGDYIGPLALFVFGVALWYYQAAENLFSFAAWGTLDFLTGLVLFLSKDPEENKAAPLPLAYGIICAFVVAMIAKNGTLSWSWVESVCLTGVILGVVLWLILKKKREQYAVISFCTALSIASVPIVISTYHNPQPWEWWLWVGTNTSAAIGMYLNYPWRFSNIASWLFVAVSTVVGNIILILTLRPFF